MDDGRARSFLLEYLLVYSTNFQLVLEAEENTVAMEMYCNRKRHRDDNVLDDGGGVAACF